MEDIMVKHVILWKLKEMDEKETESVKAGIKEGLEGLAGRIPGLVEIHVHTNGLAAVSYTHLTLPTKRIGEI